MKIYISLLLLALAFPTCAVHRVSEEYGRAVDAAIESRSKNFDLCYRDFGKRKPVDVTLKFEVNFTGDVQFVEFDDSLMHYSNDTLDESLLNEFRGIKFPTNDSGNGFYGRHQLKFGH